MSVTQDPSDNPFAAPEVDSIPEETVEFRPLPCPQCDSRDIIPAPYSAWHGRRAPKAVQDVICQNCGTSYNGETGLRYPPRTSPILWFLLALGLFVAYLMISFVLPLLAI